MAKIECPSCKAQIEENMKFCTECGTKMEPEGLKCPECSAELAEGVKFCTECGANIETAPVTKPKTETTPNAVICPKCRKKITENIKFCKECGTPLKKPAPKEQHEDEVDKLIKEAKETGKGLLKEANGLLKKFTR